MAFQYLATIFVLCAPLCSCQASSTAAQSQLTDFTIYPPLNQSSELQPLFFGLMMSFGGTFKSSGVIPGVQMALDLVNNKTETDILKDYTLHYVLYDSQCNRTEALDGFFSLVLNQNSSQIPGDIISILGSGCSTATISTAEIAHYYDMAQVSCVSSADELSNRARFRSYYQLLPSDLEIAPAFHSIIREYNWTRVAFIMQNEPEYIATTTKLKESLVASERLGLSPVEINERRYETDDILLSDPQMTENPFDENSRIFVLAMSSKQARQIICRAYNLSLWHPRYVFLTYGSYESNWWVPPTDEDVHHLCTPAQRARVLQRSLAATHIQFVNQSSSQDMEELTDTYLTRKEFLQDYWNRLHVPPYYYTNNDFSQYCYDATWSLIKAINTTIEELGDLLLDSPSFKSQVIETLNSTTFDGITGQIMFDSNGIRVLPSLDVIQYREVGGTISVVNIAQVKCGDTEKESCSFQYTSGESEATVWPAATGGTPYDGVERSCIVTVHVAISVIFVSMSSLGLIFTVIGVIFNFRFRDRKVIRLTSPNLNYFIGLGAVLAYVAVILLFVQPTTNPSVASSICVIQTIALSLGFTIAFAAILAKIGRIYIIFRLSTKKVAIKDWYLVAFVLLSNCVNGLILVVYVVYEGVVNGYGVTAEPNAERLSSIDGILGIKTEYFVYECSLNKTARTIVVAILFGYSFILMAVALWFAFQIRKVKITGLNDSKSTAAIVYICSIMAIICVVAQFGIKDYLNIYPLIYGSSLLIGISALVGLVFIPKMLSLYRNPTGEGIFSGHEATVAVNAFAPQLEKNEAEAMEALKMKIKNLEDTITKFTAAKRNSELLQTLSSDTPTTTTFSSLQ